MPQPRSVQPELLDDLPPDDPRAIRSRADLRRVNGWMGQAGLMARLLARGAAPAAMIEIGSGDGTFMLRVARRLAPRWSGVTLRLIDRAPLVTPATIAAFRALGWSAEPIVADVFEALETCAHVDLCAANLFLHHFEGPMLAALLGRVAACADRLVACEPRRSRLALAGSRMLFAIGANHVTRHDALVSVRAGFAGAELSAAWPRTVPAWHLDEAPAGMFTHGFVARRTLIG